MTVFIIEDSELIRRRLIPQIENIKGINVLGFADDARSAGQTAAALSPDVVVLDLQLIHGNGLIVLLELKRLQPAPMVIVLSGTMNESIQVLCRAKGADYVLDKSFEIGLLKPILKDLLTLQNSHHNPAAKEPRSAAYRALLAPVPHGESLLLGEENP